MITLQAKVTATVEVSFAIVVVGVTGGLTARIGEANALMLDVMLLFTVPS